MSSIFELIQQIQKFKDAFGNQVSRGTNNKLDLPADKPYSEERFRLFENGDRVNINYSEGENIFEDLQDVYKITVPEDEEIIFRNAEKQRYVVGYEAEWSNSFELNRELQGNEFVEIMLTSDNSFSNGHGIRFESGRVFMFERRDGENLEEVTVDLERPVTDFTRFEMRYNWYNVGNFRLKQSFTRNGEQINKEIGKLSVDGSRGSKTSLGYISTRIHREEGSPELFLEHGSLGYNILGSVTATTRGKGTVLRNISYEDSPDYSPLFAVRINPEKSNVTAEIDNLIAMTGPTGETIAVSVDPELTDATGWEIPPENTGLNSVVQFTENVSTFPDSDGNEVTSAEDPGGFQVGITTTDIEGQGAQQRRTGTQRVRKRPIYSDDVIVVLGRADEDGDYSVRLDTEQEW